MSRILLAILVALLVAGCGAPTPAEVEPGPASSTPAAPALVLYRVQVVVSQERPDGPRLPAEVHATRLDEQGRLAAPIIRPTDGTGVARFELFEPGTYLVRVLGPAGWTQEGARIDVAGDGVRAAGLVASEGDLFVPLYRASLAFAGQQTWSTTVASNPGGEAAAAFTGIPLALPDGLGPAYAARLATAQVAVRWSDTVDGVAPALAAGLVVDGQVVAEGEHVEPQVLPGERQADWSGAAPDAVRTGTPALMAAAITRSAVVGNVLLDFEATLTFGGQVPPELPPLDCHARYDVCGVPLPPGPPLSAA